MSGATTTTAENALAMSDEDFLKLNAPPAAAGGASADAPNGSEGGNDDDDGTNAGDDGDGAGGAGADAGDAGGGAGGGESAGGAAADPNAGGEGDEGAGAGEGSGAGTDAAGAGAESAGKAVDEGAGTGAAGDQTGAGESGDGKSGDAGAAAGAGAAGGVADSGTKEPDYKAFHDQIMKPFTANGKEIKLASPDEAIRLMQMGANYTRKMQELAPHRKMLMMLQGHKLDEDRLSFLIDLDKGDPEAIKKLLKDKGVDPLEIDTTKEPAYLPGGNTITDEEANFRAAVSELSADQAGKETLVAVNGRWDNASKDALFKSPAILATIHQQRLDGIYDVITAEVDRRITLGILDANTPFIQAYHAVGDELAKQALAQTNDGTTATSPTSDQSGGSSGSQPVGTSAAKPRPAVNNGDKASAAAPTRSSPSTAKTVVNPLALSDDDFLKQFDGRV